MRTNAAEAESPAPDISIRQGMKDDSAFIFATWLRAYRHGSDFTRAIRDGVFFDFHSRLIARLLTHAAVRIAHPAEEPGVILGYLVHDGSVLHFCYVKAGWRRMGLARTLMQGMDLNRCVVTHKTRLAETILAKYPGVIYNPYAV